MLDTLYHRKQLDCFFFPPITQRREKKFNIWDHISPSYYRPKKAILGRVNSEVRPKGKYFNLGPTWPGNTCFLGLVQATIVNPKSLGVPTS